MNIEPPKDADGREVPLDTKVLYDRYGYANDVRLFAYFANSDTWRVRFTSSTSSYFAVSDMYLDGSDSWEKLEEDLGRGVTTLSFNDAECDYFGRGSGYDRCKGCPAGKRSSCTVAMLEDVATRIRKLRGEDR